MTARKRRAFLRTLAGMGAISIAGCSAPKSSSDGATPVPTTTDSGVPGKDENLPDECPLSQDLEVEWPRDLDDTTVADFLKVYEKQYYLQSVFEFDRNSRYGQVGTPSITVKNVSEANGGWRVHLRGLLGVRHGSMVLRAKPTDPPEGAEGLSPDLIEDQEFCVLLNEAVETGEASLRIGSGDVDEYVDRFEAMSDNFEIPEGGGRDTLYFDMDGKTVELDVDVGPGAHGDYWWDAWYYVDEHVIWRSGEQDIDPREGELLECRTTS